MIECIHKSYNISKKIIDRKKRIVIVSIIPLITFFIISIMNMNYFDYKTITLVFSNLSMLPTVCACTYFLSHSIRNKEYKYSLFIEFALSYAIIFISGFYHFCDRAVICFGNYTELHEMDYIASYTLIATYIFHVTRINIVYKIMLHIFQITVFIFCVQQTSLYTYILYFYAIPAGVVISKLLERYYKKKVIEFFKSFNIKYFISGISLFIIGLIFGPLQLQKIPIKYYWIYHSFGWHLPVMLASYCILKSTVKKKPAIQLPRPPSFSIDSNQSGQTVYSNSSSKTDSTFIDMEHKHNSDSI